MKVAAYIRVSTTEQAQEGYSLDSQKERLLAYCTSQGWNDVEIYMDDGATGTNMNRPALKRMIRHIEAGQIQAVIVLKLDRLSRKQKDALYLLEEVFDHNDVIFKSATEPFDTSTSLGKAMIGILAVFAQLERDMIVERTTSGRRQRVSEGKWYGGRVPFGYSWNKEADTLEIVPEEASIIQEIYTRYSQGASRLSIAEWVAKRVSNRVVDHNIVRDMLSRPVYMGKFANAGELADGNHEAIIDPVEWYDIQKEVERRKDGRAPKGEFLLTGLLKCGVCGSGIVHVKRITKRYGKEYKYELYACINQHVRAKDRGNNCSLGYFRRDEIEQYVIEHVKQLSTNPDQIQKYIDQNTEKDDSKIQSALKIRIEAISEQLDNLYDAIQAGDIKASAVGSRIAKLEEDRESFNRQLDDLQDATPQFMSGDGVKTMFKQIGELWEDATEEERKIILRQAVLGVTMNSNGDHEILWNLG